MTDTQKDFLLNYGPKLLGIDTTFNVSKTSLKLTIIVVLDEFDTGIPVAMFLSQTTKKDNLKLFFSSLISKTGFFSIRGILSDGDKIFYNSWCEAVNQQYQCPEPQWIECGYHKLKTWGPHKGLTSHPQLYQLFRLTLSCTTTLNIINISTDSFLQFVQLSTVLQML